MGAFQNSSGTPFSDPLNIFLSLRHHQRRLSQMPVVQFEMLTLACYIDALPSSFFQLSSYYVVVMGETGLADVL